jgi:SAM-dependent methyltransferase
LDVGSGDINGNNREFFDKTCTYQGNDVFPGRNVDLIYKTKDLPFFKPTFHTIISTECFEHDPEYVESLKKIVSILQPGGLFVFSCASTGRPEHGTRKTTPIHSLGTRGGLSKWRDYYKNLTLEDIKAVLPLDDIFVVYRTYYDSNHKDLMFWGIKKGVTFNIPIPEYVAPFTMRIDVIEDVQLEEPVLPSPTKPALASPTAVKNTEQKAIHAVTYEDLTEKEKEIVEKEESEGTTSELEEEVYTFSDDD